MKMLLQTLFLIVISNTLYSQNLAGHWNGVITVQGTQLRVIFHVTKNNLDYQTMLDSPDQNTNNIKVTTTRFSYPNVTFEIANLGIVYEGIISDKGITGKWIQSGTALYLFLVKSDDNPEKIR